VKADGPVAFIDVLDFRPNAGDVYTTAYLPDHYKSLAPPERDRYSIAAVLVELLGSTRSQPTNGEFPIPRVYDELANLLAAQTLSTLESEPRTIDLDDAKLDIHHIFPRRWCDENNVPPNRYNSVVNKTPISLRANRSIGGKAPSLYLSQIEAHPQVDISAAAMDAILVTHRIKPSLLRANDFDAFIDARRYGIARVDRRRRGQETAPARTGFGARRNG
jgi:hypothetical protein